ncbi:sugar ABC transporter substrate-binding protein [Mesorhizobium sp. VK9D]|uniref:ABC transporter substrate-binding protein n=1 Tax=Mesorhizobium australafricanum TaxID=3072311 RepID=UPI002A2456AF|nr:sugar ABC transporter substrate-binding protein [Mesorhizobium sp. VK9D]MDX8454261.1 sugar ABC transporter substrate-binding protein [Mesorhizobium sp. VK9D]
MKKFMNGPGMTRRGMIKAGIGAAAAALAASRFASQAYAASGGNITVLASQPQAGGMQIVADAFKEATGVSVEVVTAPLDQIQQQLTLDLQSGAKRFDAFDFWYVSKGALADQGILLDLTDRIAKDAGEISPDDYIPALYDAYSLHKGKRYSLPFDGDTHALFFNKEIFERNGVTPPKTWDDVVAVSKKITEAEGSKGIYGMALMGVKAPILNVSVYANRLANYGGAFINDQGKPALSSDAALAAAENLVATVPYSLPTPAETGFEQALTAFIGGKAAMTEGWTDLGTYADDPKNSKVAGKWDVVPLPIGGKATTSRAPLNAGWTLGVSTYSQKQDVAWAFIKLASSAAMGLKLITTTGSGIDPFRKSNLNDPKYIAFNPGVQRAASSALNGAVGWPSGAQSPRMLEALSEQLAAMVSGETRPEDGLANVQAAWERLQD